MARFLLALLLVLPGWAMADPISAVVAVANFAAAGAFGAALTISAATAFYISAAATVIGAVNARRKARKAAAAARAAYNASLQDRTVTVLRADPPWQVIYGRTIVGGAIVDIFGTDKTGARREDGSTYTKADALKHLVIVVAAHEVEAIHEIYIDGVPVGALDGSGNPTGGEFAGSGGGTDTRTATFTTSITLTETPLAVLQAYSGTFGGDASDITPQTVTIAGNTLNGPAGIQVSCDYTVAYSAGAGKVRISKQLGADAQATNTYLAGLNATRYTAAHRLRGLAYVVVTLDLEEPRFQGGPPNITFDVSGRKVFDPRTSTTAWSDNPALCIRDFLTARWGLEVAAADIDNTSVIAAANACDELITLTTGATNETNQKRFTCNGAFTTDQAAESTLEDMAESMAGLVTYGAQWSLSAGTWTTPGLSLTDDDLHGQIEVQQADTPISELFNGLRGQFMARGAQSPSDFNPYQNATFVTADGRELWTNLSLPFTDHLARARNLCRIFVERNRSGQVIRYPAKLKAWPLQIGDRVQVTSAEYGLTAKTFRVTDWQFDIASAVVLTLQEDDASIYDLADAAVADPTPNTDLPNPWNVAAITGLAATSGTTTLQRQGDGTIVARVLVSWTAIADGAVTGGGSVVLSWRVVGDTRWTVVTVAGAETQAFLPDVREGDPIVIEARARNTLGALSPAAFVTHLVVGKSAPPSNVTGLGYGIKPGQVVISWTACPDVDYRETELRYGATWAAGTLLWRGAGREYQHPRPANGTYIVWAAHIDTSGNYSAAPASVSITVDDSIDPGASKVVVIPIYRRSATTPALPSATATYDFGVYALSGLNNGWSATVPAGSDPVWVAYATAVGTSTDTIAAGEWSTPQILAQDGSAGVTTASVALYQRTTTGTPPSVATGGSSTYTFATGGITGQPSGWTTAVPGSGGGFLWVIRATAAAVGTTDTIVNTEWSSPVLMVQDGAAGGTGQTGQSNHRVYRVVTIGSPPATPSPTVSGATPAGWSVSPLTLTAGQEQYQSDGVTPAGSTTTTWSTPYPSYLKVGSLSAIAANLGTITAGDITGTANIQISGTARLQGVNSAVSIPDPSSAGVGPFPSYSTAVLANETSAANIGLAAFATLSGSGAIVGYNASTGSSSAGVFGRGANGVWGVTFQSGRSGVRGVGSVSGATGVYGAGGGSGGWGVVAEDNVIGGSPAGGGALDVIGKSRFSGQIISTVPGGTAPLAVSSSTLCNNLNADLLDGFHATSFAQQSAGNAWSFDTITIGGATASFTATNKPGSFSGGNQWMLLSRNGTFWAVPIWQLN